MSPKSVQLTAGRRRSFVMKRKKEVVKAAEVNPDTSKPTAVFEATTGRAYTVSVALPGSIIANALTPELKGLLAGQIARALAVFCVDEVVIFDDGQGNQRQSDKQSYHQNGDNGYTGYSDPNHFLIHLLSYLETPPFLRKHLFPMHPNLKLAGSLPSLDMPHHLRSNEWCRYREGVTIGQQTEEHGRKKKRRKDDMPPEESTLVDVGLSQKVSVPASIPPHTRVTIELPEDREVFDSEKNTVAASAVAPSTPREEAGYYWGYTVRGAPSLSAVITECTYPGGYDLTFGTSERGAPIADLTKQAPNQSQVPQFNHILIVFGGVAGLEAAVEADDELRKLGVKEPKNLFDYWVNLCPGQGSRTIRTEEAIWLGLMGLREVVLSKGRLISASG
ncbi:MAG: hypothetical protein LQ341_004459 [Variospora aurantia]|nr:MAG: hypothetical protein LQ341_004459 [Variospora aurantia]